MVLLERPSGRIEPLLTLLTLEEYLSLPDDTRWEIVDGALRQLARANTKTRTVQRRLANVLAQQTPADVAVAAEEVVVLQASPPTARIPDVAVFAADIDPNPAFWRIELEPSISVQVYRLIDQVYRDGGVYTRDGLIKDPTLPWLSIEVNDLLGDYA